MTNTTASIDLEQLDSLDALTQSYLNENSGHWYSGHQLADGITLESAAAFIAAANPATLLPLIALARRSLASGAPAGHVIDSDPGCGQSLIDVALEPGTAVYRAAPVHDAATPSAADADKEARQKVAEALGLGHDHRCSFTWSYLLGAIRECAIAAEESNSSAGAAAKTEQDRRILLDTIGDLGEALLKARDWLSGNTEAIIYINKSIALAGIRPAATAAGAGSAQPRTEKDGRVLSKADIDEIVYKCRQSGKDTTYDIVNAAIRAALARAPLPAPVAQPVDDARDAARYRWLREQPFETFSRIAFNTWDNAPFVWPYRDQFIDAAMRANDSAAEGGSQK